jgi:hypothetical protein
MAGLRKKSECNKTKNRIEGPFGGPGPRKKKVEGRKEVGWWCRSQMGTNGRGEMRQTRRGMDGRRMTLERKRKCWDVGKKKLTRADNNILQHTPLERIHICRSVSPATKLLNLALARS